MTNLELYCKFDQWVNIPAFLTDCISNYKLEPMRDNPEPLIKDYPEFSKGWFFEDFFKGKATPYIYLGKGAFKPLKLYFYQFPNNLRPVPVIELKSLKTKEVFVLRVDLLSPNWEIPENIPIPDLKIKLAHYD